MSDEAHRSRAAQRRRASAGLLLYRRRPGGVEVFLVHPGGPFFARRDAGAWSIPKGEIEEDEEALDVARREFAEETGQDIEACAGKGARFADLGTVTQRGGKRVRAWAVEGDWPPGASLASEAFTLEWPPRSGTMRSFPEVDRGEFFALPAARERILTAQAELLDRLETLLAARGGEPHGR